MIKMQHRTVTAEAIAKSQTATIAITDQNNGICFVISVILFRYITVGACLENTKRA